jgi:hypothetical protein
MAPSPPSLPTGYQVEVPPEISIVAIEASGDINWRHLTCTYPLPFTLYQILAGVFYCTSAPMQNNLT